mgnify:CR=1 FL=1
MLQLRAPNLYLCVSSHVVSAFEIASDPSVVVLLVGRFCELLFVSVLQGVFVRVLPVQRFPHDIAGQDWIGEPVEGDEIPLLLSVSSPFYAGERMTNFVLSLLLVHDASHPLECSLVVGLF